MQTAEGLLYVVAESDETLVVFCMVIISIHCKDLFHHLCFSTTNPLQCVLDLPESTLGFLGSF